MNLSIYERNLDIGKKNIDFNHIEYIEIIDDFVHLTSNMLLDIKKEYLKKGDVISLQYLSGTKMVIKLNDKKVYDDIMGISNGNISITCHQLYWNPYTLDFNYFRIITKEMIRDKKINKLLKYDI